MQRIVLGVILLIFPGFGSASEADLSDKRCWMVNGDQRMKILKEDTIRMIKALRNAIETELQPLGNKKLKEIEFEFQNQVEFAFHFVSNTTNEELLCLSVI